MSPAPKKKATIEQIGDKNEDIAKLKLIALDLKRRHTDLIKKAKNSLVAKPQVAYI